MNSEKQNELLEKLNDVVFPILQETDDVIDGLVLLTVFTKSAVTYICASEGLPVKKNLKNVADVMLYDDEDLDRTETLAQEAAIRRSMVDLYSSVVMNPERSKQMNDDKRTVVPYTMMWSMRDKISEVLRSAELDIPKEIITTCIVGTLAQWTGKPVSFYDDTKEGEDNKS